MKVTVITPVYNGERFIRDAIESVLKQTYQDWQYIVIDDGSSDSTPDILRKFSDPRIEIVHQKNMGEAEARNTGLKHAKGDYIAFLDADDLYMPDALENLTKFLNGHPEYDSVYSDGYLIDEKGGSYGRINEFRPGNYTGNILDFVVITNQIIVAVNCTLTRKSVIEKIGARFDPNLVIGPDWDFWIQIASAGKFGYLDQKTCKYRVHQTNISRTTSMDKRRRDYIYNRRKAMRQPWFSNLAITTRRTFFSILLMHDMHGLPELQEGILQSEQCKLLTLGDQARLWRRVGVTNLQTMQDMDFARFCLKNSLKLNPDDKKAIILNYFLTLNSGLLKFLLGFYHYAYLKYKFIKTIGKKKLKPVPKELGPTEQILS